MGAEFPILCYIMSCICLPRVCLNVTGESQNPDGHVALLDYREDGITPYMLFFKDGVREEKYVRNHSHVKQVMLNINYM